jgi:phosphoglucosamine mutase
MPTPSVSHLVRSFALDLGIMITASHNPYYDNGIKVFNKDGTKLTDAEQKQIEELYFANNFEDSETIGRAKRIEDVSGRYIEFLKAIVDNVSLDGFKIVVDCANGAAYKTAPTIFRELGAQVIETGVYPDGYNINKGCGSLYVDEVSKVVIQSKADLGIALDGDADRAILIDEKGMTIDGDYVMAMIAKYFKEKGKLNKDTLVVTTYSNLALDNEMQKHGITVKKVTNGDREISALCKQEGYNFGGEQTGHYIFKDYTDTGDGTLAALMIMKIIKEKNKKLSELAYTFDKFPQKVFNIEVTQKTPLEELPTLTNLIKEWENKLGNSGRIFVRYSGTENLMRVMVESESKKLLDEAGGQIVKLVNELL